jgi:hypothetical protein
MAEEENVQQDNWQIEEAHDASGQEVLLNTDNTDSTTETTQVEPASGSLQDTPTEIVELSEEDHMSDEALLSHMLSERYGQEFNDFSAYEDYLSSQKTTPEDIPSQFANETLQQINDYVKNTGRSVEDYMMTQSLQPDEMSDQEAVMFMLERENPNLSKDDLKFFMEETYKLKADDGSTEKRFGEIALKKEAIKAKSEISEFKSHYKTPVSDIVNAKQNEEEIQAKKDSFYNEVVEDMKGIEGLTFDMDDKGTEFTFAINDENRPKPEEYVNQLDNFFNQYVDEAGEWDYDRLNTDMFILNNIDSIVKSVANHYKGQGTEEVVQELKNPSYGGQDAAPTGNDEPTIAQQIYKAMQENNHL